RAGVSWPAGGGARRRKPACGHRRDPLSERRGGERLVLVARLSGADPASGAGRRRAAAVLRNVALGALCASLHYERGLRRRRAEAEPGVPAGAGFRLCSPPMSAFAATFSDALSLLATFDHTVAEIVVLSLQVSGGAVVLGTLIGLPLGACIAV